MLPLGQAAGRGRGCGCRSSVAEGSDTGGGSCPPSSAGLTLRRKSRNSPGVIVCYGLVCNTTNHKPSIAAALYQTPEVLHSGHTSQKKE